MCTRTGARKRDSNHESGVIPSGSPVILDHGGIPLGISRFSRPPAPLMQPLMPTATLGGTVIVTANIDLLPLLTRIEKKSRAVKGEKFWRRHLRFSTCMRKVLYRRDLLSCAIVAKVKSNFIFVHYAFLAITSLCLRIPKRAQERLFLLFPAEISWNATLWLVAF